MTESQRRVLRKKIDEEVRRREGDRRKRDGDVVIAEEEETQEAIEHDETLRRAALVWRKQQWRLYTKCTKHGEMAYCAGPTRDRVVCLACWIDPDIKTQSRRRRTMSTEETNLRTPFLEALMKRVEGLKPIEKKAYVRVVDGTRTVAYVNGERRLKVDVPREGGGLDGFSIKTKAEIAGVVSTIAKRQPKQEEEPAEAPAADVTVEAPAGEATATASGAPGRKSRSRGRAKADA
jgi:hypothetical protein